MLGWNPYATSLADVVPFDDELLKFNNRYFISL